jgi:hypothetical protein
MALSEAERVRMLEEMAADDSLKATQRLRALEELGRIENRRNGGTRTEVKPEDAPDPMADLDEVEAQRRKRKRRAA